MRSIRWTMAAVSRVVLVALVCVAAGTARADVRFEPGAAHAVEMRRAATGQLLIKATLAGLEEGWFILDTGAGMNCIDTKLAERLGFEAVGGGLNRGASGELEEFTRYRVPSLSLGPATIDDAEFGGIDLSRFPRLRVIGIIGQPIFERLVFLIDARAHRVEVYDPDAGGFADAGWVPMRVGEGLPVVDVVYEGERGEFLLDTGATRVITFHAHAVQEGDLLDGRETRVRGAMGSTGPFTIRTGLVEWIELWGVRLDAVPAVFYEHAVGASWNERWAGLLGSGALDGFVVLIDYKNRRTSWSPHEPP